MTADVAVSVDRNVNAARRVWRRVADAVNFSATNRVPRALLTHAMGRFSRIRQPLVAGVSIALWRRFSALDLSDAKSQRFASLHDCFTRELRDGARPFVADLRVLASPVDAIVGACGRIDGTTVLQAKGRPYTLEDLLLDGDLAHHHAGGTYATLRLRADMYHRFHAPADARVRRITYVAGDVWNVNPPAVARVHRLFCRNERAIVRLVADGTGDAITLVPVAAILVASIRFTFADVRLHLRYRGPNDIACDVPLKRGAQMGWFEHGSTIIVLAPPGYELVPGIAPGATLRAGNALMRRAGFAS